MKRRESYVKLQILIWKNHPNYTLGKVKIFYLFTKYFIFSHGQKNTQNEIYPNSIKILKYIIIE